ncbi:MBL fold metallo-hydrolase [Jatrophihabitans fulvus]
MASGTVTWLGHAGVAVDLDGVRLLTDPVLRDRVGPLVRRGPAPPESAWRRPDGVLISHLHHDHLDVPSLRRLGSDVPLVVPVGAAGLLPGFTDVRELPVGRSTAIAGVTVTAVPAHHGDDRLGTGVRAQPRGYLIGGVGATVWFAGDTGVFPGLADLRGGVDVALLPVGGWGPTLGPEHLDPRRAAGVAALVQPRLAVPVHWGTLLLPGLASLRPVLTSGAGARFARWAGQLAPGCVVRVGEVGTSIAMP